MSPMKGAVQNLEWGEKGKGKIYGKIKTLRRGWRERGVRKVNLRNCFLGKHFFTAHFFSF